MSELSNTQKILFDYHVVTKVISPSVSIDLDFGFHTFREFDDKAAWPMYDLGKFIIGMKSLALSIACAVGFASPAFSGDLGRADIASRNDLPIEYSFSANCFGSLDKVQGPECAVNFADGKMTVDGSSGIFPHQATSVTEKYYNGAYYVNLQYETLRAIRQLLNFFP